MNAPSLNEKLSVWVLSVVAVVLLPLFPIYVEWVKDLRGSVKTESLLLTTAVLAAGYGFSSENNWFRSAYLLVFFFSVGYDFRAAPHPTSPNTSYETVHFVHKSSYFPDNSKEVLSDVADFFTSIKGWCGGHIPTFLLIVVALLHMMERFLWHVVFDRRFPDWIKVV